MKKASIKTVTKYICIIMCIVLFMLVFSFVTNADEDDYLFKEYDDWDSTYAYFELNLNDKDNITISAEVIDDLWDIDKKFEIDFSYENGFYACDCSRHDPISGVTYGTYGLALKMKNGLSGGFEDATASTTSEEKFAAFLVASIDNENVEFSKVGTNKETRFKNMLLTSTDGIKVYLEIYRLTEKASGIIYLPANDFIAECDITDWLNILYEEQIDILKSSLTNDFSVKTENYYDTSGNDNGIRQQTRDFIDKVVLRYGTYLAMFILLISLITIALSTLLTNQDGKARVLLSEKLKHILVGAIILSSAVIIINFGFDFVDKNMESFYSMNSMDTLKGTSVKTPKVQSNWAVDIIFDCISTINAQLDFLLTDVIGKYLAPTLDHVTLGDIIMYMEGKKFTEGISLTTLATSPYTITEFELYMIGYSMLAILAIAILAIALVKNAGSMIIFAGNAQKIAEVKSDYIRFVIGVCGIILAPFLFRGILLVFNILTILVPIKDGVSLELSFPNEYGYVGIGANFLAIIMKFKIFLAFIVRKVMLTFMFISAPVILATWTVSAKFRSFSIWFGELITNAATQFSYTVVLYIVMLIGYGDDNPFMRLILVTIFIKLADFLKDSLQGLITQWGGINESAVAEEIISHGKSAGSKLISAPNKIRQFTGNAIVSAGAMADRTKTTNAGRITRNVGNFVLGNFDSMESKRDIYKRERSGISGEKEMLRRQMLNVNAGYYNYIQDNKTIDEEYAFTNKRTGVKDGTKTSYSDLAHQIVNGEISKEELERIFKNNRNGGDETALKMRERLERLYQVKQEFDEKQEFYDMATELVRSPKIKRDGEIVKRDRKERQLDKVGDRYLKGDSPNKLHNQNLKGVNKILKDIEKFKTEHGGLDGLSDEQTEEISNKLNMLLDGIVTLSVDITNDKVKVDDEELDDMKNLAEQTMSDLGQVGDFEPMYAKLFNKINSNISTRKGKIK